MRKVLAVMGVCSVLGIGAVADQQQTQRTQNGDLVVLKVNGMACGACAARVEKTAKELQGVSAAKANQPKGVAEITFDASKTSAVAIAKWISEKTPFKAEVESKQQ